ncbi:MAG: hypothetical protein REI64_10810 [Pedobacter sp.]|uniref:hypothetical protein n=1 Tax=Pedobacter sp. TaxID=1411316 RepID=UPI0028077DB2|nr:hypothetical protein [Pedobacter sp.]MDQ8005281.1 hypothetical protein [Pedobacter sp.]
MQVFSRISFLALLFNFVFQCSFGQQLMTMDMVHHNPGEPQTESQFLEPSFLKTSGYDAKVFFLFEAAQFGLDWQAFDQDVFPENTAERRWVDDKNVILQQKYTAAKNAGLKVYCMLDMLVFPAELINKYKTELCNNNGRIDISKPFTQKCIRSLINQIFDRYAQMDGLIIRTGETYLHDAPYHKGGSPLVNGYSDHVTLVNILREEVCEKRNKQLFYRTWDFGRFHSLPKYYLEVTNQVAPHPNLYFSVKHTIVDFWRSAITQPNLDYNKFDVYWIDEASKYGIPFNPCIGIGKHQQIVEVQAQREYEGKAAHPNYIGKGIIDGFEEFKIANSQQPYSLNQIKNNPLFKGIWTWSRGGGWYGPYIKNEFWAELNARVAVQWAKYPEKTEEEIFVAFAREKGLNEEDIPKFRELCLLSADGVMMGQYSRMGGVHVNWTRDNTISGLYFLSPYFDKIIAENKVKEYLDEKAEALAIWKRIEKLSKELRFNNKETQQFVRTSSIYGKWKFQLLDAAWKVMLNAYAEEKKGNIDLKKLRANLKYFDETLIQWQQFVTENPESASVYVTTYYEDEQEVGIATTLERYRQLLK